MKMNKKSLKLEIRDNSLLLLHKKMRSAIELQSANREIEMLLGPNAGSWEEQKFV